MGRPMRSTLRAANQLGTVCEWLAVDDSAISASFRTFEGDDRTEFADETKALQKVAGGPGDEAFQGRGLSSELYVRSGTLLFVVGAFDINQRSGIDVQAVRLKMAQAVIAKK